MGEYGRKISAAIYTAARVCEEHRRQEFTSQTFSKFLKSSPNFPRRHSSAPKAPEDKSVLPARHGVKRSRRMRQTGGISRRVLYRPCHAGGL